MRGYHFSEQEEVAHVDCLEVKMRVIKLCWRYVEQSTGEPKGDPKEGFEKQKKKWLDAIQCQWWEGNSLKNGKFHSRMLIPWVIAEKGTKEVEEWLEQIQ